MSQSRARRQRRAQRWRSKKDQSTFYRDYVRHLPEAEGPMEPGRVYHMVIFHDSWCRIYDTDNPADCNCNPTSSKMHVEPRRS